MITAAIKREPSTDQGTFGLFSCPAVAFSCFSLELPWRNNKQRMSCIPTGTYICKIYNSPKFGIVFHLTNVQDRSYVLFHSLNYAGDTEKGWQTHSHGCIGLGLKKGWLAGQMALLNSRITITDFQRRMNNQPFKLIIT